MAESLQDARIVIAGGSGFLGVSLAQYMAAHGAKITILSRRAPNFTGPWKHVTWDARTLGSWQHELNGASGLINLAGRSVNCIKTRDHQDEILRSRVEATRILGAAMRAVESPPPVWAQMSTAHIYGDPPDLVCNEDSAFGYGLAPFVGRAWEDEFRASVLPTQRGVILRTSFVLGRDRGAGGGALSTLKRLAQFGLGGRVGSGRQGMSWIHEIDLHRLFERALLNSTMHGACIASAPQPVAQHVFMRELRRALRMPFGLPAAAWMVQLGATHLLRTDPELALYGRYVVSKRLAEEGFEFEYPELTGALREVLSGQSLAPIHSSLPVAAAAATTRMRF